MPAPRLWLATAGRLAALLALLLAVATPLSATAAGRTQHYGPYASDSPDSSTCGNIWATDYMDRDYTVDTRPNADGTYNVTEQFKNGSFVTFAGDSPGGCETNPGGTIRAGVTGTMQGEFTIVVSNGHASPRHAGSPAIEVIGG